MANITSEQKEILVQIRAKETTLETASKIFGKDSIEELQYKGCLWVTPSEALALTPLGNLLLKHC